MSGAALDKPFVAIEPELNAADKELVLEYERELDLTQAPNLADTLSSYTSSSYTWHGVYPFETLEGAEAVAETFYQPLFASFTHLQRRPLIFFGGRSVFGGDWVMSMGNFLGMFTSDWLGIPATGRMAFLRYCEFHRLEDGKLQETYFHTDLISLMKQAGVDPLPPQTGTDFVFPSPRTNDGIILSEQAEAESAQTLELIQRMAYDLGANPEVDMAPAKLAETWHQDMIWYGPSGIGSTMGIGGFKQHHQMPFRKSLYSARTFNGHAARFTEGLYGGWVGWPSLSLNVAEGGFMGLPKTGSNIDMRVVDLYRREGDRLAENWVFIDIPYVLKQQGLDVLERMRELRGG